MHTHTIVDEDAPCLHCGAAGNTHDAGCSLAPAKEHVLILVADGHVLSTMMTVDQLSDPSLRDDYFSRILNLSYGTFQWSVINNSATVRQALRDALDRLNAEVRHE